MKLETKAAALQSLVVEEKRIWQLRKDVADPLLILLMLASLLFLLGRRAQKMKQPRILLLRIFRRKRLPVGAP